MRRVLSATALIVLLLTAAPFEAVAASAQQQLSVEQCNNIGRRFSDDARIDGCTAVIRSGRYRGSELSKAYTNRGVAWSNKKYDDRAIADFSEAIRLDPNDAAAYYNRGNMWLDKKDSDRAIADYGQAVRLDPNDAEAFFKRGRAWSQKEQYDRAIADYDRAIRLTWKYEDAYRYHLHRGLAWSMKKDYDRAIADYDLALRLNPDYADAYLARGAAWSDKKNADRAIDDLNDAIRLEPKEALAFSIRGNAWSLKKDYDRAVSDYEHAIRLDPKDGRTYWNRALLYLDNGRRDQAIADLRKAHELGILDAREKLRTLGALAPSPAATAPVAPVSHITITSATLGQNCGAKRGNVTTKVAALCNGKENCALPGSRVNNPDPAFGCAKAFAAQWQCSGKSGTRNATVGAVVNETRVLSISCK